jgi:hypothetical protein
LEEINGGIAVEDKRLVKEAEQIIKNFERQQRLNRSVRVIRRKELWMLRFALVLSVVVAIYWVYSVL